MQLLLRKPENFDEVEELIECLREFRDMWEERTHCWPVVEVET